MSDTSVSRTLIPVDARTGAVGEPLTLHIGETVHLQDPSTDEIVLRPIHCTTWNPLGADGNAVDAVIRLETSRRGTCIVASTPSLKPQHPAFAWLRELAKELHSKGIRYVPQLRKDERMVSNIIDVIRV